MQTHASMQSNRQPIHIMLIGPLPPPIGGTTVSFRQLVDELSRRGDVVSEMVDTCRGRRSLGVAGKLVAWPRCAFIAARKAKAVDVITLHCSSTGLLHLAPLAHLVARWSKKPLIVRVFGGGFDVHYTRRSWLARLLLRRTALSAELCLFQTQQLVRHFSGLCRRRASWYSNSRPMEAEATLPACANPSKRFIFVGHISTAKGIPVLLEAAERLKSRTRLDIYGPLKSGYTEASFSQYDGVQYRGVLDPSSVVPTMRNYRALVMPSWYEGEGYPGVILEAFAAGIPVIASRWRAIPELVDSSCGILVQPGDAGELASAMETLLHDETGYNSLCKGVRGKRKQFDSEYWTEVFVEYCRALSRSDKADSLRQGEGS